MSESAIATRVEDHGFLSLRHRPSPGGVYAPHSLAPAITPRTLLPLWGHGCGGHGTWGSQTRDSVPAVIPTALEKAPCPKWNMSSGWLCL